MPFEGSGPLGVIDARAFGDDVLPIAEPLFCHQWRVKILAHADLCEQVCR
ncbi:hypothetical protein H4W26_001947 [Nesterenkonia halotolerans]|uniref:Uncharacterized protein n=1 Tax=Nesterenkonia halotolerans TaxID=225325 RepID=A0ABR9J875_9MICC|nr:hypothetical protein [Nesterenkonia halotolerans]MBE1515192.1 hypothetical protein [Nesterenkonia halotolerans]